MLSPRRSAQCGLAAACVLFVLCMGVLVLRGSSAPQVAAAPTPGIAAPDFTLPDTDGKPLRLSSLRGSITVLYFGSINCPVSVDYETRLAELAALYAGNDEVRFVGVNSLVPARDLSLREIAVQNRVAGLTCPQLVDAGRGVADLYGATVTPTFFVIDRQGLIRYRGAFDDNRSLAQVRTHYVADAIRSLLNGRPVEQAETQPIGCAIK